MTILVELAAGPRRDIRREAIEQSLEEGDSLLHVASRQNSVSAVRTILEADGGEVTARSRHGYLAIHFAADMGHLRIVASLLSAGSPIDDQQNAAGWSPLHFAAFKGHLDAARALVRAGADVDARDGNGWKPVDLATINRRKLMVTLLQTGTIQH